MAGARSVDVILGSREKDMTNLVNKQKHATIELFNLGRKVFGADRRETAPHQQNERFARRFAAWIEHPCGVVFFIIAPQH